MPSDDANEFLYANPQVFVTDLDRGLRFWVDLLGFEIDYTWGAPAFYAQVHRGNARLNLRHVDESPFHEGGRDDDTLLSAAIPVENAPALFEEYRARGVPFQQELCRQPWGAIDFVVRDPDGNLLNFGSTAPD